MKQSDYGIAIINIVLVAAGCLFLGLNIFAQSHARIQQLDPEYAALLTNAPPLGFATRLDYLKSFKSEKDILAAYHSGKISEPEAELAEAFDRVGPNDKSPMDAYGKVIDQNGQPVAGAKVHGYLSFESTDDREEHDTKTDEHGRFNFLGLHGKNLDTVPEKAGYEYNIRLAVRRPPNYVPDPNHPLIFTMWKLRGGEPMWYADTKGLPYWYSFFQSNGSPARINLRTCRDDKYVSERNARGERHYDLEMALHLDEPIKTNANRVLFCNWSATIGITNGGLVEIPTNTIYPYEAPVEGYQPSLTLNFPTNMVGWTDQFKKRFYFKSENGKTYGRIKIEMNNWGRLNLEIYANPGGSRNLEFDPSKEIMR